MLRAALRSSRATSLGTIAIWLAMTLAGLWLVSRYGLKMPFADEWCWLGRVTGEEPVTWSWLWAQHNEHRIVLPRLIYLGLGRLSGFDFRAAPYFDVVVLSGLSLLMMGAARFGRGAPSWYDSVFPLVLLQWSPYSDLIWGFQLAFVISVSLTTAALLPILSCRSRLSVRMAVPVTACLLGAGLCGANGLAYLPPVAGWLLLATLWPPVEGGRASRKGRLLLGCLALALAGFCILYFMGFTRPAHHAAAPSTAAALRTTAEFLAGSLGWAGKMSWPVSGFLVLAGCGLATLLLLRAFIRRPEERLRAAGLLAWLAGTFLLAAGIGCGRAFLGPGAGLVDRYMLLSAPLLCFFSLVWNAYASPRWGGRLQGVLLLLVFVSVLIGVRKGPRYAADIVVPLQALERDAQAGFPAATLAVRYGDRFAFGATLEAFSRHLEMLRIARLGPYRGRSLESIEPVAVQRFIEIKHPAEALCTVAIPAGRSFVQPFRAAFSGVLRRIDVQIGCFGRRDPGRLDWTLLRIAPHGVREVAASGEIRLAALEHDETASLVCPPVSIHRGQELELELNSPATDGTRLVRVPLYDAVAPGDPNPAIKGFLFLNQQFPATSLTDSGSGYSDPD
jgi:hypothetical protein